MDGTYIAREASEKKLGSLYFSPGPEIHLRGPLSNGTQEAGGGGFEN